MKENETIWTRLIGHLNRDEVRSLVFNNDPEGEFDEEYYKVISAAIKVYDEQTLIDWVMNTNFAPITTSGGSMYLHLILRSVFSKIGWDHNSFDEIVDSVKVSESAKLGLRLVHHAVIGYDESMLQSKNPAIVTAYMKYVGVNEFDSIPEGVVITNNLGEDLTRFLNNFTDGDFNPDADSLTSREFFNRYGWDDDRAKNHKDSSIRSRYYFFKGLDRDALKDSDAGIARDAFIKYGYDKAAKFHKNENIRRDYYRLNSYTDKDALVDDYFIIRLEYSIFNGMIEFMKTDANHAVRLEYAKCGLYEFDEVINDMDLAAIHSLYYEKHGWYKFRPLEPGASDKYAKTITYNYLRYWINDICPDTFISKDIMPQFGLCETEEYKRTWETVCDIADLYHLMRSKEV